VSRKNGERCIVCASSVCALFVISPRDTRWDLYLFLCGVSHSLTGISSCDRACRTGLNRTHIKTYRILFFGQGYRAKTLRRTHSKGHLQNRERGNNVDVHLVVAHHEDKSESYFSEHKKIPSSILRECYGLRAWCVTCRSSGTRSASRLAAFPHHSQSYVALLLTRTDAPGKAQVTPSDGVSLGSSLESSCSFWACCVTGCIDFRRASCLPDCLDMSKLSHCNLCWTLAAYLNRGGSDRLRAVPASCTLARDNCKAFLFWWTQYRCVVTTGVFHERFKA
jgi:hypothetical protein